MVKYLSCPDLHFSPEWIDTMRIIFRSVIESAKKNKPDFVLFPGDLYDKAIYATDKGGINELIDFITELRAICPVAAIEGTKSHDYPGCYGPLERAGLILLQPGKTYGMEQFERGNCIRKFHQDKWNGIPDTADCLLFGIPEVTKEWYQANNPTVSADSVNAACTALVHDLIRNEIAPIRSAYPNTPAVLMMHGNVSDAMDKGTETDVIMKASDIVIRTSVLAEAGLTRVELGHIHTPWESTRIEAGYAGFAGIDRNPWNKTEFTPSMLCVEIDNDQAVTKTRIPYGTPKRVIISEALDSYDPDVAYWLKSKSLDDVDPAKKGAHPWSRITYEVETKTERRLETSEFSETKTLPELGRLYDKDITDAQVKKLAEAERKTPKPPSVALDVRVSSVVVTGCTMLGGGTVTLNIDELPEGLNQITGANGSGKSSLLGFCSPYPCFIGKDTDSGRQSAIKDFFKMPESGIQKTIFCNGEKHEHVITIRGAHTKTPKVECYLTIAGRPALEKATFDELFATCERLYGSMADYLMTSFYVQPLQGKFESGLMTANMTTVRDLVQNIAGINHENEKRFCLDRVNELDGETKEEKIRIEAETGSLPNIDEIKQKIDEIHEKLDEKTKKTLELSQNVSVAESAYTAKKAKLDHAKELEARRDSLSYQLSEAEVSLKNNLARVERLTSEADASLLYRTKLESDAIVKKAYNDAVEENSAVIRRNAEAQAGYQKTALRMQEILATVDKKKAQAKEAFNVAHNAWKDCQNKVSMANNQKKYLTDRIDTLNKPCPNCGYIEPDVAETIKSIQAEIKAVEKDITPVFPEPIYTDPDLNAERAEYAELQAVPKPEAETYTMPERGLSDADIAAYKQIVDSATSKRAESAMIKTDLIPDLEKRIASMRVEIEGIKIEHVDISNEQFALDFARSALNSNNAEISTFTAQIESQKHSIDETAARLKALESRKEELASKLTALVDWKYCADMLSTSHLPAMELDAFLDSIDAEATRQIVPYRSGRYMYRSSTQQDGKSSVIDKFDIIVHDGETGIDKSLLKYSVGEKSFLQDAYVKALIKIRTARTKTTYSPIISDEADSFIEIPEIPSFYEMQKTYYGDGSRVLVVSHSPDAGNYIQNHVNMSDIVTNKE